MKIQLLLIGCILMIQTVYAQDDQDNTTWSLHDCLQYALVNNSDIAKSQYDQHQARYQINEVKSSGLPQLSGFGNFDYNLELPTQILPGELIGQPGEDLAVQFGQKYNIQGGFQLSQLLFSQSYFVGLKAAKTSEDLYRLRQEMSEEQVIYNIGVAYYQILQTNQQMQNLQANLSMMEELNRIMQLQYENDLVKKVDLNRIEVNTTNLITQQKNLHAVLVQQENALKFFMGMPMTERLKVKKENIEYEVIVPAIENLNAINQNKTGFKLLQTQENLYWLNMKNTQSGYYPTLSAYGQLMYQAQRNESDFFNRDKPWFRASAIGLQLNIPIFDGLKKQAQVQQAKIDMEKHKIDMQDFSRNTYMELENSVNQLELGLESIKTQEQNVQLAENVYDTTYDLYKEGITPLTDLLEADQSLRSSRTSLNYEILKYKIAGLDYLKAKGELNDLLK